MGWAALYERRELRRWWRGLVLLALLFGLLGGVVLAAAAGSRRTSSAFPRLFEDTDATDVLVNPDEGTADFEELQALPGIKSAALLSGASVMPYSEDGELDLEAFDLLFFYSPEGSGIASNRPLVTKGRLPDPDRADEVFANNYAAEGGYQVGDRFDVRTFSLDDLELLLDDPRAGAEGDEGPAPEPPDPELLGERVTLRVVGEGVFPDQLVTDDADRLGKVIQLTPAFGREHPVGAFFTALDVQLDRDVDGIPAFVDEVQQVTGDELVFLQTKSGLLNKAARSVQPFAGALAIFAAIAAAAGALILGQAVVRQALTQARDFPSLRAIGVSPRQYVGVAMLRWLAIGALGAVITVVIAIALSPAALLGPARRAEPNPGVHIDSTVLAVGFPVLLLLPALAAAIPTWLATRAVRRGAASRVRRPSAVADALARGGLPSTVVSGVRMALEPGGRGASVPVRTTIVGVSLSLAALSAALTFGGSLDRLLSTPRLYGANWDLDLNLDNESAGEELSAEVEDYLRDDDRIARSSAIAQGQFTVDGQPVPALGVAAIEGGVRWTLRQGEFLGGDDTIVLGTNFMRRIGVSVGDMVEVSGGGPARTMEVVGQAVFARFAAYPGADKIGLGDGAVVTLDRLFELSPTNYVNHYLLDVGDGSSVADVMRDLDEYLLASLPDDTDFSSVVDVPPRPDDIQGYDDVDNIPLALAGLLLLVAGISTAHALVLSVRRRARDLALLKTIGFSRRQVSTTVAAQATTIALIALVVGIPLGVAAGRGVWSLLADRIGALAEPAMPWVTLAVVVPAALAAVNLVAALPARRAGRTRAALALRAE